MRPDPILANHVRNTNGWSVAIGDLWPTTPVAHRRATRRGIDGFEAGPACGVRRGPDSGDWHWIPTHHAQMFARPCRRCWPGAPAT